MDRKEAPIVLPFLAAQIEANRAILYARNKPSIGTNTDDATN